jgi:hypothetical protein
MNANLSYRVFSDDQWDCCIRAALTGDYTGINYSPTASTLKSVFWATVLWIMCAVCQLRFLYNPLDNNDALGGKTMAQKAVDFFGSTSSFVLDGLARISILPGCADETQCTNSTYLDGPTLKAIKAFFEEKNIKYLFVDCAR